MGFDNSPTYRIRMNKYISENCLNEYITFIPHDYNKSEIFKIIDFGLIPSFREGLSLVAIELQAAKIPTIASLAVPESTNIGYLHRISLDEINSWADAITNSNRRYCLNKKQMGKFDRQVFLNNLIRIYS